MVACVITVARKMVRSSLNTVPLADILDEEGKKRCQESEEN